MNPNRTPFMVEDPPLVQDRPGALPNAETGSTGGDSDIHCPLCGWMPAAKDRWMCRCRHSWNTFDTGGVCPGCLHQWTYTQCLACHSWSPHSEWYPRS